ncbi:MAG: 3-dehydroquinate synthase [Dehalococcoidia bacterium]|nr:3-dehydroquinate synthase [Dehalococcoidia bacterium]
MSTPEHITLIGFSGTGKTEVAKRLAALLGWEAIDSDDLIEQRSGGRTPAEVIAEEGEFRFRAIEAVILSELASRQRLVVACGGGAPVNETSRRSMVEAGLAVWLDAHFEETEARDGNDSKGRERPLRSPRIFDQRAALYRTTADYTVLTDTLTPEDVAKVILAWYRLVGEGAYNRPGRIEQLLRVPSVMPAALDTPHATAIIRTASGDYPAYVDWGGLERLGEYVKRATGARRAFVISDDNVLGIWGETALSSLREAGIDAASLALEPGDGSKSIENAGRAYDWLASLRAERRDAIVALGGGMVDDFAGFIAGTYMRGMPVVQAPTSLLAMVDASIGGKTAINHVGVKNIVGLFYQPRAVVADVATLKTLPRRALVEGLGEVIKHALIRDPELLELLEVRLDDLLALEPELTTQVIARNVQIKGEVVSEDERETGGVREILNYGHTLGHAFEAAGGYESLLHGEAVAAGMMAAAEIGRRVGVTPPELVERQRKLIERAGLPLRPPPGLDRERILAALSLDKKVVAGGQRWVLLEGVGRPVVRADVPSSVVEAVLDDLLSP